MSETLDKVSEFKRQELKKLYNQCTESQQGTFKRMYGSLEGIREDQVDWAIKQCEFTIKKNENR